MRVGRQRAQLPEPRAGGAGEEGLALGRVVAAAGEGPAGRRGGGGRGRRGRRGGGSSVFRFLVAFVASVPAASGGGPLLFPPLPSSFLFIVIVVLFDLLGLAHQPPKRPALPRQLRHQQQAPCGVAGPRGRRGALQQPLHKGGAPPRRGVGARGAVDERQKGAGAG